jgi:hypothetical protein
MCVRTRLLRFLNVLFYLFSIGTRLWPGRSRRAVETGTVEGASDVDVRQNACRTGQQQRASCQVLLACRSSSFAPKRLWLLINLSKRSFCAIHEKARSTLVSTT